MKKQLLSASAAACFTLAGITPAVAEVPITLNAGVGYWFFNQQAQNFEAADNATPFVGMEYAFNDQWAAEVLFASADTHFTDGGPHDADVDTWQLGGKYYVGSYIGEPMRLRPYLALGGGQLKFDANNQFDSVDTTVNGGLGVRWMLGKRVGMNLEGRTVYSIDESDTNYLVSAGLNLYLGKVTADAAAPAACADADADGVCDDKDRCPGTPAGTRVDANGCPLPVAEVASIKLKVNFAFDSTKVQEKYFTDLKELADFLKRFSDLQVNVEGHTDSVGTDAYNQNLSQRRAKAVVDLLVNQYGIARSRLEPVGYGESQPVASNDTAEGRAENRRV
ncbi:MAG TPA: OmpA family protein, partial [Halioglobus sp.]